MRLYLRFDPIVHNKVHQFCQEKVSNFNTQSVFSKNCAQFLQAPPYVSQKYIKKMFLFIHSYDIVKLILHSRVRNSTTHLTLVHNKVVHQFCHEKVSNLNTQSVFSKIMLIFLQVQLYISLKYAQKSFQSVIFNAKKLETPQPT